MVAEWIRAGPKLKKTVAHGTQDEQIRASVHEDGLKMDRKLIQDQDENWTDRIVRRNESATKYKVLGN